VTTATPTPVSTAAATATPGPFPTPAPICNHPCPDLIRFGKPGKPDNLQLLTAFPSTTVLDPTNEAFTLTLRNANGVIYTASLVPGDLLLKGKNHRFLDRMARKGLGIRGGLAKVELRPVPKKQAIRVTIQAYSDLDAATLAEMTAEVTLGDDTIAQTAVWLQKSYGWRNPHH
jgi:hypothetical protein